jgi:ribose 5-phosphate isomerase B
MKIALSTDHAGYERIKSLKKFLEGLGHECSYFGPTTFAPDDDYPDFIYPAAQAVADDECERGIIFGGSGEGEAIVANRVKGIRCTVYYGASVAKYAVDASGRSGGDPYDIVRLSREHNDANMLSIGARFVTDDEVNRVVQVWLDEPFSNDERHIRRIKKIDNTSRN